MKTVLIATLTILMRTIIPHLALLSIIAVPLAISCQRDMTGPQQEEEVPSQTTLSPEVQQVTPIFLNESELAVARLGNEFGLSVFRALEASSTQENILFSPLSLSLDLAMVSGGAEGETESQILSTIGFAGKSAEDVSGYYRKLVSGLSSIDPNTSFFSANSIWVDYVYTLRPSFTEYARQYYDADITTLDLSKKESLSEINQWCDKHTNGMIPSVLDDSRDPDNTSASYLLNALYFKGLWTTPFEVEPSPGTFHSAAGDVEAQYLSGSGHYRYKETETVQLVAVPYGGGLYHLVIALPKEGLSLHQVLAEMTESAWFGGTTRDPVTVRLPKFSISYNTHEALVHILKEMGMSVPFVKDLADFSGMFSSGRYFIENIFQQAAIDVDEKGTEAAGGTVIGILGGSLDSAYEPVPRTVNVNRPFAFAIIEDSSRTILMLGENRY